jgi:hypothetical protein
MSQPPTPTPSPPRAQTNPENLPPETPPTRCLSDPNFFRLRYQLAAQSLNDALLRKEDTPAETPPVEPAEAPPPAEREDRRAQLERESRELAEQVARVAAELADSGARAGIRVAQRHAEELLAIVRTTIDAMHDVTRERTRWRRSRTLTPQQLRLKRFLEKTVQPCSELIVGGARAALGEPDGDKGAASAIRDSVRKGDGDLSYRVAYNLACYELACLVEETAEESWALALDALRIAFRDAPNQHQRAALVAWARKDPALKAISAFPDFETLLHRNEIEEAGRV